MNIFARRDQDAARPVFPNRDTVYFPGIILPVIVTDEAIKAFIQQAMDQDRRILVVNLRDEKRRATPDNMYPVGTICHILQFLKLPDSSFRVLLEGQERVRIIEMTTTGQQGLQARTERILPENNDPGSTIPNLSRLLQSTFAEFASKAGTFTSETKGKVQQATTPDRLVDLIAGSTPLPNEERIELLEERNTVTRMTRLTEFLSRELQVLEMKRSLRDRVRKRFEKNQRDIFLQEQIREINREMGRDESDEDGLAELELRAATLPDEVEQHFRKELLRLRRVPSVSPEAGMIRTYLDWLLDIPWPGIREESESSTDSSSSLPPLSEAARILDEDHYDMEEPKNRILEFIAVQHLNRAVKSPILCFVGPPGTGKTSLGKSMARALERAFIRFSLGGVRDEAEIRGHRRTYVGAMPGRIIQGMKRAGTADPVILLDEIDKIGSDHRGDPASALLEVLDPEQNHSFSDHYIELSYDLSRVTFVTTANSLHTIPAALRDRLEVIEIPGYTERDKCKIAQRYLIPQELAQCGLQKENLTFRDSALSTLIREYTQESGVRNLKRQIASVVRKIARDVLDRGIPLSEYSRVIQAATVRSLLGPPRFRLDDSSHDVPAPGMVNGLAWTESGGVKLTVEAVVQNTKGDLILTGSLGDVMKESARIALSVVRNRAETLQSHEQNKDKAIHIHVPQGAIPKDGPSAGITLYTALFSALSRRAVPNDIAMSGEITLTGRVLAVGGIKEKILAARRHNISKIILPRENKVDLDALSREYTRGMVFHLIEEVEEIMPLAFPDYPSRPGDHLEEIS